MTIVALSSVVSTTAYVAAGFLQTDSDLPRCQPCSLCLANRGTHLGSRIDNLLGGAGTAPMTARANVITSAMRSSMTDVGCCLKSHRSSGLPFVG